MIGEGNQFTEDKARLSEAKRALLDKLLKWPQAIPPNAHATIPRRLHGVPIPLSFSQQQVWAHSQMVDDVPLHNEQITDQELLIAVLREKASEIVNSVPLLRSA
jgi:hypothetical protein